VPSLPTPSSPSDTSSSTARSWLRAPLSLVWRGATSTTVSGEKPSVRERTLAVGDPAEERRHEHEGWEHSARGISVFVEPDVALHVNRDSTARRHLARRIGRVAVLLAGDIVAASTAAWAVRGFMGQVAETIGRGHVAYSSVSEVCSAVVLALLLTGNYQRKAGHTSLRVLMGCALGAVIVSWSAFWAMPTFGALPTTVLLSFTTAATVFAMRGVIAGLSTVVLPKQRLVPAVVIAADATDLLAIDERSGYRIAGRVILDRRESEMTRQNLARLLHMCRAESVIAVGNLRRAQLAHLLEISHNAGCELLCSPPGFGITGLRPTVAWRGPHALLQIGAPSLQAPAVVAKRCMDIVFSSLAMLVVAPLAGLIALAIRLDSPGPVFFRQERVGLGGRRFMMVKFRTMRVGADAEKATLAHLNHTGDRRLFKIPNDPRISRVGAFLRRWSLDEIPQFWNVFVGHMSLVGPRPFFEEDLEEYEKHHFRRLGTKPGITGLWQVTGRSSVTDFEEVVRLDTDYINRWSLWLDFKILLLTLPAVLRRTGAF
jgi:exopolysaccharide biosynthesis polyprenyl glycosylphosphotransferase